MTALAASLCFRPLLWHHFPVSVVCVISVGFLFAVRPADLLLMAAGAAGGALWEMFVFGAGPSDRIVSIFSRAWPQARPLNEFRIP